MVLGVTCRKMKFLIACICLVFGLKSASAICTQSVMDACIPLTGGNDLCRCLDQYIDRCVGSDALKASARLRKVAHDLCAENSEMHEKLMSLAPCMRNVSGEILRCNERLQIAVKRFRAARVSSTNPVKSQADFKDGCCEFDSGTQCSVDAVTRACGPSGGEFQRSLFTATGAHQLEDICSEYFDGTESTCSASTVAMMQNVLLVASQMLLAVLLCKRASWTVV